MSFTFGFARARARQTRTAPDSARGALLSLLALAMPAAAWAQTRAAIVNLRFGGDSEATRIVFDLSSRSTISVTRSAETPGELSVTIEEADRTAGPVRAEGPGHGLIRAWSRDSADPRRFTLTLARPAAIVRRFTLAPAGPQTHWRAVLDLAPARPLAAAPPPRPERREAIAPSAEARPAKFSPAAQTPAAQTPAAQIPLAQIPVAQANAAPVIVIDAGHGGKDPGATGVTGAHEKDVTLAAAQSLAAILRARGYDVRLTRDGDRFIELEGRVAFARAENASLFISLHADSGAGARVAGASVYTLSERGGERAKNLKAGQDWTLDYEGQDRSREVSNILLDLTQRNTKNRSAQFASLLLDELGDAGPVLAHSQRNAGFFVLLAPDVPAVLLEMGFMSSKTDEERLRSAEGRRKIALAAANAVDRFFHPAGNDGRFADSGPVRLIR